MSSLHLAGSPWWLLLLLPGAWLLWRQYRGMDGVRGGRGIALLALQSAALLILCASLTAPEWVRRSAEFHDPAVLILRDRSGSFQGGDYLALGKAYAEAEAAIAGAYRGRSFEARVADFHESAWPVSGFGGRRGGPPAGAGPSPLTSLAAAADFVDSAGIPNLRAIFLLSDGRAPLDSGRAARSWPVPVFPVSLPVTGIAEAQPERVTWSAGGPGESGEGFEVAWAPVGPTRGNPRFRLLRGSKILLDAELPSTDSGAGTRIARVPWKPAPGTGGWEGLRAVIRPAADADNLDPWNDTLPVGGTGDRGGRRLELVKPLRGLDEKGMADLLHARDGISVRPTDPGEIAGSALGPGDQVWVDAATLAGRSDLLRALAVSPARVVVYARPGALPAELAGIPIRRLEMTPEAEVRPSRAAADAFPVGVVRLKAVSTGPLQVPAAEPPWREAASLSEGGRKGLLMAWFPLGPGKEGLFLSLPRMWGLLFDPQADFTAREHLAGLLGAAIVLADRQEGAVKAVAPKRVHAGLPFGLEFTVPPAPFGPARRLTVRALPAAGGEGEAWEMEGPGPETFRREGLALPEGRWILELSAGQGAPIWRDSLVSAPKAALELARIGFDADALRDLAAQSGGRVLSAGAASEVASMLPNLPGAQVKEERATSRRLYNTRTLFLLAVALLAASWVLRKRWDLD